MLHPGRPELPLNLHLLEHHRRTSSMLMRLRQRWCQNPSEVDFSSSLLVGSISANSTESTSRSIRGAELQPVGICWELESKRRPLVNRRQGRCVPSRGICRNSTVWTTRHIRRHRRLGSARDSPGQLACSGINKRRDPTPHAAGTLQAIWARAPGRCRILSRAVLEARFVRF